MTWDVPYQPGTIQARGADGEKILCSHQLQTAGVPAKLVLLPDRSNIAADGADLSHVEVRVVDENGVIVPDSDALIGFDLKGPGKIAGVDNGDLWSTASYKGAERKAYHGRCLVIVRSQTQPGQIQLTANAKDLPRQKITLETQDPEQ